MLALTEMMLHNMLRIFLLLKNDLFDDIFTPFKRSIYIECKIFTERNDVCASAVQPLSHALNLRARAHYF